MPCRPRGPVPDRPLRVAMVAFAPNHHTTRWARALVAAGVEIHVVCIDGLEDFGLDGIVVHPIAMPKSRIPVLTPTVQWHAVFRAIDPDVIYMQWLFATPSALLSIESRYPLVLTVMGSDVRQSEVTPEQWHQRVIRTALLLRADAITAAAQPLADVITTYDPSLENKTSIVPFGVDTSQFVPTTTAAPAGGPLRLGHFKGDDPIYGRLDLLRAVEPLLREGMPLHLLFSGRNGLDGGAVEQYLWDHPHLRKAVTNVGRLTVDEMPQLYGQIDVYVLNSTQESFGVAAAEALASEVPVIASDVGGVGSLVHSGETGVLIPPSQPQALRTAIVELATYPALRRSLGQRGRAWIVEHFEWHRNVQQLVAILQAQGAGRRQHRAAE